jgi:hypothetical protein
VDLEREWRDFLRGWIGGVWEGLSALSFRMACGTDR